MQGQVVSPPDALMVWRRALCLTILLRRAGIERVLEEDPAQAAESDHLNVESMYLDALAKKHVRPALSMQELELLDSRVGSWNWDTIVHAAWRLEALGVLVWAMKRVPTILPYDQKLESLNGSWSLDIALQEIQTAQLRPEEEIRMAREEAVRMHADATKKEADALLRSIAAERHHALNWLCGDSEEWNLVPHLV